MIEKKFKMTDAGALPEEWETTTIESIKATSKNAFVDGPFGSNLKSIHFVKHGDVFVIESSCVTSGKFIPREYKTITSEHFKTISRSECFAKDVIIAKIGMKLIVVGTDLSTAAENVATVSTIDSSADDVDVLTVDAVTGFAADNVIAEAGNDSKIKAIPNGLTYCDNVLDPDAYAIDIDYIWNCMEKPVLERRMPPLTASLKKALRDNECYFRFSPRK